MIDFNPQRIGDRIMMFLEKDNKPITIPVEYQPFVTTTYDWDMRILTLKQICNQFSRPLFERIWFLIATASILIVPTAFWSTIRNAVFNEDQPFESLVWARWIAFGLTIGMFLFFFVPIAVWKRIGKMRIQKSIRGWHAQDRAAHPDAPFVPTWSVTLPGTFMIYGKLKITVPPRPVITVYSQNAYIPPYLANSLAPPGYNYYPPSGPNANPAIIAYGAPITGAPKVQDPFVDSERKTDEFKVEGYGVSYERGPAGYTQDAKDRV